MRIKQWVQSGVLGLGTLSGCMPPPHQTASLAAARQQSLPGDYYVSCYSQRAFTYLVALPLAEQKPAFVIHRNAAGECVPVTLCSRKPGDLDNFLRVHDFRDAIPLGVTRPVRPLSRGEALRNNIVDFTSAKAYLKTLPECRTDAARTP